MADDADVTDHLISKTTFDAVAPPSSTTKTIQIEMHETTGESKGNGAENSVPSSTAMQPQQQQQQPTSSKLQTTATTTKSVRFLPILFERSADNWWNPRFDSDVLERQHLKNSLPQNRRHIRYVLAYVLTYVLLSTYFHYDIKDPEFLLCVHLGVCVLLVAVLVLSCTGFYATHVLHVSVSLAVVLGFFEVLSCVFNPYLPAVVTFVGSVRFLIILYKFIPLPLYLSVTFGSVFTLVMVVLAAAAFTTISGPVYLSGLAMLHFCAHVIGINIFILSQVRRRSTFFKVGQSILSRRDLQIEKQLKHNMIHSLMPPKVAEEIMKSRENDREEEDQSKQRHQSSHGGGGGGGGPGGPGGGPDGGKMNFRSFHMSQMDNVSILFADIVGFTKMSSNKSAEHLVSLLNDLFGRFDDICKKCNCEKISTLGDCYYCVSGCPEPRPDHAKCCVEMGLAMCIAIKQFDEDHKEEVNMRVGVHTGTVLCGLVGTRRFKFDVWSHDVTLANMMESEGKPGCVHVSDCTYVFINNDYEVESGEDVPDIRRHKVLIEAYNSETQQYIVRHVEKQNTLKTWFIIGRTNGQPIHCAVITNDNKTATSQDDAAVVVMSGDSNDTIVNKSQAKNQDQIKEDAPSTVEVLHMKENLSASPDETKGDEAAGVTNSAGVSHLLQTKQRDEEADKELVRCISECSDVEDYLYRPPINQCTLNFLDSRLEDNYRRHGWDSTPTATTTTGGGGSSTTPILNFSLPHITSLLDMIVSFSFFSVVSLASFFCFLYRRHLNVVWVVVFLLSLLLELFVLVLMYLSVFLKTSVGTTVKRAGRFLSSWYPRHAFGALIVSLPTIVVCALFDCDIFDQPPPSPSPPPLHPSDYYRHRQGTFFYWCLGAASLLHFCNFTMLSSIMKSLLATVASVLLIVLLTTKNVCFRDVVASQFFNSSWIDSSVAGNFSSESQRGLNGSTNSTEAFGAFSGGYQFQLEIVFDVVLLVVLLCFINREIEIGYRVCYHGDVQAVKDRQKIETEKEQADWLLHNIVPEHVADLLKHHDSYCKNHKDVGVIFAKISNFEDFYDESFEGGKEYLRVLNELMGDFEDLFDDPRFKDVEKIKTIGSCLMAASGLNPQTRNLNRDPNAHLFALMDFSMELLKKLEDFNKDIFNFDFEMSVGFNFGEVTAGVVGTTKLLYDIWGDTVNIASRMYSTGVHERIQVTEDTAKKLDEKFDFEHRGAVYVKGKGDMNTYLLVGKKPGARWD